jgi:hypothetical protein
VPLLDEKHDFAHPVEADTAWSESYYFNGYDPETDTGLFTRIGVRPNEGTIDVGLSVWLPESGLATVGGVRPQDVMIDDDLAVAGVCYQRVAPMREWRLTADAEGRVEGRSAPVAVAVDLTFTALTPAIGTDGQGRASEGLTSETARTVGKGHLEQAGRWSGWVQVAGERYEWGPEARGNRDKSWGPRRWGGPTMWRWFSVNVGDDVHFGGIRIGTQGGDLHRGWVWRDGEAASVREWRVRSELADDGITHRVTHVDALDARGRAHVLRGDILRVAGLPRRGTLVNEGLARWTYEGRVGYGIAEYLHQLNEQGRPVVPVD